MINVTPGAVKFGEPDAPQASGPVIDGQCSPLVSIPAVQKESIGLTSIILGAIAVAAAGYLVPKAIECVPRLWSRYSDGTEGDEDTVDFEVEDY